MIGCYTFGNAVSETVAPRSIGYARVSTAHQDTDAQVAALKEAGCDLVFHEVVSTRAKESDRQELQQALRSLIEGDELVVAKLDRLGRTQVEVINRLHFFRIGYPRQDPRWSDQHSCSREDGTAGCGTAHGSCRGGAGVDQGEDGGVHCPSQAHWWILGGRPKTSQARADLVLSYVRLVTPTG